MATIDTLTIGALRRRMATSLAAAFRDQGRAGDGALDARILLAHALGRDASGLALADDLAIDDATEAVALDYVRRRTRGEPVARIVGRKEFWGLDLAISGDTLLPRPDTETVVEAVLAVVERQAPLAILDLGTGSGAILLALLSELPQARGIGTDRSRGAIEIASANAARLGLAARASFAVDDWAGKIDARFDIVVSNPPYIATSAIDELMVDVRDYDPHLALDGGADGLGAYRSILADLPRLLVPEGRTFLEIGFGQADAVEELARRGGWKTKVHPDLGGISRVVELSGKIG